MKDLGIKDILLESSIEDIFEGEAYVDTKIPYICYRMDSESASYGADNGKEGQAIEGTVDLYTKDKNQLEEIQELFRKYKVPFTLYSIGYDENNVYHFEWVINLEVSKWLSA